MRVLEEAGRAVVAAVAFLTRVPIGGMVAVGPRDVARGAVLFPLVGGGIGALIGLVAAGLDARMGLFLAAALAVALEAILTGAIHLDALADTADGLGAATRERALEVMREANVGAFGALALVLDLLVKTAALAAVATVPRSVGAVVAAFAVGRAAPLALGWALPYARPTGGSGAALTDAGWHVHAGGLALGVGGAVGLLGVRGLALVGGAGLVVGIVWWIARRRLGGVTGDVLGAAVELATTAALVAAAATR
jgi:adenosylcobinamide-GDP ribazoletransferase